MQMKGRTRTQRHLRTGPALKKIPTRIRLKSAAQRERGRQAAANMFRSIPHPEVEQAIAAAEVAADKLGVSDLQRERMIERAIAQACGEELEFELERIISPDFPSWPGWEK